MVNTGREKMGYIRALDEDCLEVFAGVFKSQQDVEDFLQITDGVPKGLMEKYYQILKLCFMIYQEKQKVNLKKAIYISLIKY